MKRFFLIILSSTMLLTSCSQEQTTEILLEPEAIAEKIGTNDSNASSQLKPFQESYNPLLAIFLFGSQWEEGDTISMKSCSAEPGIPCAVAQINFAGENPILDIDFARIVSVEELIFNFSKANIKSVSISVDGKEIYQQEPFLNDSESPLNRISYLSGVETDKLSITFILEENANPKELSLSSMECYSDPPIKQVDNFEVIGYIPTSEIQKLPSTPSNILIGNTYWDASGNIQTKNSIQGEGNWCTINPQGELIRAGSAGDTINTPEKQTKLAQTLSLYCKENNYIGIDIDWEFPKEDEWADFSDFIVKLKETLSKSSYKLSLALYPKDINLSKEAIESIDAVNIMAYDQFDNKGYHSTYQAGSKSIDYFLQLGFTPKQLRLGIPLYGRPLNKENQWPLLKDARLENPFQNIKDNIFYNNEALIMDKVALAQSTQLAGVMLYHLNADYDENPVTQSILAYSKKLDSN